MSDLFHVPVHNVGGPSRIDSLENHVGNNLLPRRFPAQSITGLILKRNIKSK